MQDYHGALRIVATVAADAHALQLPDLCCRLHLPSNGENLVRGELEIHDTECSIVTRGEEQRRSDRWNEPSPEFPPLARLLIGPYKDNASRLPAGILGQLAIAVVMPCAALSDDPIAFRAHPRFENNVAEDIVQHYVTVGVLSDRCAHSIGSGNGIHPLGSGSFFQGRTNVLWS